MTSALPSARPPSATIAWATRDGLYAEIPCASGPPFIVRYPLTTLGLQQALNALLDKPDHTGAKPGAEPHPKVKRPLVTFTDDQRASVRAVLKAKGIT